jgi:hypothetical protein
LYPALVQDLDLADRHSAVDRGCRAWRLPGVPELPCSGVAVSGGVVRVGGEGEAPSVITLGGQGTVAVALLEGASRQRW